jgi:hypothetical protein
MWSYYKDIEYELVCYIDPSAINPFYNKQNKKKIKVKYLKYMWVYL